MKPLKEKECENTVGYKFYGKEDVASAVEFLKDRMSGYFTDDDEGYIMNMIDEAFEDVVKGNAKGTKPIMR